MDKSELLQLQTSANTQDNSTSSEIDKTVRLELETTPYYVVGNIREGYTITFGKYKISETFGSGIYNEETIIHRALEHLEYNQYNILFHTMCAIQNVYTELTKDTIKTN